MLKTVMLNEMTRVDLEEYLEKEKNPVVFIVVGSHEQHGHHIALGRDCFAALDIAKRAAENTNSLVVHPTWIGFSPHHMAFKGTITLKAETLLNVLIETAICLAKHGFQKIMYINSHGGNKEIVAYAAMLARRQSDAIVVNEPQYKAEASLRKERSRMLDLHAGKGETGRMLAIHPNLVDMDRVKGWKPTTKLRPELLSLLETEEDQELAFEIVKSHLPDTAELTSSGIYGFASPEDADVELAKRELQERIDLITRYVSLWKTIPSLYPS